MSKVKNLIRTMIIAFIFTILSSTAYMADQPLKIDQSDLIYFVFTDRFHDGDPTNNFSVNKSSASAYQGGDFQGIIDKLNYIKELGFTTIWISPVVDNQTAGYHGYWTIDFYKTEEHFGSIEKLKELVQKAHSIDMKVILDMVVNHTGHSHPWAEDPSYNDWFNKKIVINDYNNQKEVEEGWLASLPDLNQNNPEVRKYLIDMAKWWIKETGVDGFRLDTVRHVPKDFWKEFAHEIKKEYPGFFMVGEVWNGDLNYVASYLDTGLDAMVDFPMYYAINDVFNGSKPAARLSEMIQRAGVYKEKRPLMGTFVDNHDVPRFVNQLYKLRDEKLMQALAFMMTYTGIPVMYYGTEIALDGGADPDNRRDMDWEVQSPVTDYVKKLTSIRKSNKALTHGDIKLLKAEKDFISYSRKFEDNTVIVAFNTHNGEKAVELSIPEEDKGKQKLLIDLLDGENIKLNDGKAALTMAPRQVNIYTYKNPNNSNYFIMIFLAGLVALICIAYVLIFRRKGSIR